MDILHTPIADGSAVELSRTLWRKKILPCGSIDYKGRKINFDQPYLTELARAFNAEAFDQVPAMLADQNNTHTMDPARFRGEVRAVTVEPDGLWGTFDLSGDAAELVKQNPKLGVSARIVEQYGRSDGQTFKAAMQHVLLTLDPRIPGLGAWTEVSLSGYDPEAEIIDLTEITMANEPAKTLDDLTEDEITALSDEELRAILEADDDFKDVDIDALLSVAQAGDADDDADDGATGDTNPDDGAQADADYKEKEPAMAGAGADLSNNPQYQAAIELANENKTQLAAVRAQLATARYEKERDALVNDGVPPALVELARPLLELPENATIDLANDNKVDATEVVRKMLESVKGYITLGREQGLALDFANGEADEKADPDEDILAKMKAAGL